MPQGGLARRATLIHQVRSEAAGPVLTLDAGNSLMGEALTNQTEGRVLVEAMNLMGYDALGVGPLDLARGVDVLLQRAAEAQFAVISCNLVWTESGEPALAPYTILERDGLRVAIIGVTHREALQGLERLAPGVELADPVAQVAYYVAELRPQVEVVIVLSHLGIYDDKALAQAVPGIDVIVGGRSHPALREPEVVGGTVIVQAGFNGEWLGRLDLGGHAHALETQRYEILFMRPDVPDDPAMAALVERFRSRSD